MLALPRLLLLLTMLLPTAAALAQVQAPAGNELPREGRPIAPHATEAPPESPAPAAEAPLAHERSHATLPEVVSRKTHAAFADQVDLSALRKLAVFDGGRVKIVDTLAREQLQRIYGKTQWSDPETGREYDPVFTYLDLIFNRAYYFDKPTIYIAVLPLREQILRALELSSSEQERWKTLGRVTPLMLMQPAVQRVLDSRADAMDLSPATMRARQQVAGSLWEFQQAGQRMLMVSPRPGSDQWHHLSELVEVPGDKDNAGESSTASATNPEIAQAVSRQLERLATAWRDADAVKANQALASLNDLIPQLNPGTYPPAYRLRLERVYNATHKFTIGYVAYLAGAIALMIAFAVGRKWLIGLGAGLLVTGFLVHTGGMVVRGILAQRWPIHNQFESFYAVTWFAVLVGMVLMFARRQWLFGAAAAALGTCALLLANTTDIPSSEVGQIAAILAMSNILYVHVNVVLASYALIALGFFMSLCYLGVYYLNGLLSAADEAEVRRFAAAGLGEVAVTGAAGSGRNTPGTQRLLSDLDKAQMIVLQIAFWLLGTGILLGAYWADHSWGRWWGWDPKETWALLTWMVYLIAIHVRLGVKRRGLVTAWLSVVGFVVMLWTYWGVNMLLAGLHSYA